MSATKPAGDLYSCAEIRAIEAAHDRQHPQRSLMQSAGAAVAALAQKQLGGQKSRKLVLILAGPGNNGGDAWVAARALQLKKIPTIVWQISERISNEPSAQLSALAYRKAKGRVLRTAQIDAALASCTFIIDGLFGIGLDRAPGAEFAAAIAAVNLQRELRAVPVLAIDVPSGISADSGHAFGEAIRADITLTFLALKPGLFTADAVDYCGEIHLETLGVDAPPGEGELLNQARAAALIPQRRRNAHKGNFGNVGIIGGAAGMVGAALLAARAALHMGPGKVYLGLVDAKAMAVDAINPEIMLRPVAKLAKDAELTALAIGMGLGEDKSGAAILLQACKAKRPMVVDADALNLIASNPSIGAAFKAYAARKRASAGPWAILSPHPGEAARLLKTSSAAVQQDRIGSARKLAKKFDSIVVLKGAGTIIAEPNARYFINTSGNPGMASGGMGDALSGMMAAFMAQGLSSLDAALLGVHLHGAAADACLMHGMAPLGLTASEVIFEARTLLNSGLEDHHD